MLKKKQIIGPPLLVVTLFFGLCLGGDSPPEILRDASFLKLLAMHYPHMRAPEPYTYPGPSPPVKHPPRAPDPYLYMQPSNYQHRPTHTMDYQSLPKWCKSMWEREECGMKCWMLRKICRNIAMRSAPNKDDLFKTDSEGSHSIPHPQYKPYYSSYYKKPLTTVTYSKTGVPNTYFAQPTWHYPHIKRSPYSYYRYPAPVTNNEIGLNPQFTYVDGNEKLQTRTTTARTTDEEEEKSTTTESTTTTTSKPEMSTSAARPSRPKGTYPVKVTLVPRYPPDSEVTTLSPHMFEYDQYGTRGYYGDRIYMSAVIPVSDRQQRRQSSLRLDEDLDSFEDFDEIMIEP